MLASLKTRSAQLPWALLLVEAAAIALSVGLAFSAQEWREARREDAARTEALLNFHDELARNRAAAERAIPYHESIRERAYGLLTGPDIDTLRHMGDAMQAVGWRGPGAPYLPRTALLASEATGALGLLEFETAGAIADAYALQGFLDTAQQRYLTETGYNPVTFDPALLRESMWVMFLFFDATLSSEKNLLGVYDRALEHIEQDLGGAPAQPSP